MDETLVHLPHQNENANQPARRVAHVMYLDDRTREWLRTDTITGLSGELIDYSTAARIGEFAEQGYALVDDGFEDQCVFRQDHPSDQIFTIHLYSLFEDEDAVVTKMGLVRRLLAWLSRNK